MMGENVEIVRGYIDAVNAFMRGELSSEAHADSFDPGCELRWHDQRTYPDTPQDLRGASEIIAFAEKFRDDWVEVVQEPLEIIEAPDGRVVAFIRQSGRGRHSDVPIDIHFFEVWAIRDGKVSRLEYFRHRPTPSRSPG
jgi:ketosteroid isomerase-like protein